MITNTYIINAELVFETTYWSDVTKPVFMRWIIDNLKNFIVTDPSLVNIKHITIDYLLRYRALLTFTVVASSKMSARAEVSMFLHRLKVQSKVDPSKKEYIKYINIETSSTIKNVPVKVYRPRGTPVPEKPNAVKVIQDKYQVSIWKDLTDNFRGTHFIYVLNLRSGVHYESIRGSLTEMKVRFDKINAASDFKKYRQFFARLPHVLAPREWEADKEKALAGKATPAGVASTKRAKPIPRTPVRGSPKKVRRRYQANIKVETTVPFDKRGIDNLNKDLDGIITKISRLGQNRIKELMGTQARIHVYKTMLGKVVQPWKITLSEINDSSAATSTQIMINNIFKLVNAKAGWKILKKHEILSIYRIEPKRK